MPFFDLTSSGFQPDLESNPTVLAGLRKRVAMHRIEGLADAEIRQRLLDEMQTSLPEGEIKRGTRRAMVADWKRVVDAVIEERP